MLAASRPLLRHVRATAAVAGTLLFVGTLLFAFAPALAPFEAARMWGSVLAGAGCGGLSRPDRREPGLPRTAHPADRRGACPGDRLADGRLAARLAADTEANDGVADARGRHRPFRCIKEPFALAAAPRCAAALSCQVRRCAHRCAAPCRRTGLRSHAAPGWRRVCRRRHGGKRRHRRLVLPFFPDHSRFRPVLRFSRPD